MTNFTHAECILSVVIVMKEGQDTKQHQCVLHLLNKGVLTSQLFHAECTVNGNHPEGGRGHKVASMCITLTE